jgi:N-acetylmuramic acid 6-phosphate etherase
MSSSGGFVQLAGLQTELRNSRSADIDHLSTLELCALLNSEDSTIHRAVESCVPVIADAIDTVAGRMRRGGRLFYIGAGTSGR